MAFTRDPTWEMSTLFDGGLAGAAFTSERDAVEKALKELLPRADALGEPGTDPAWVDVVSELTALGERAHELYSFAHCIAAAHARDARAQRAAARIAALWTAISRCWVTPEQLIASASPEQLAALKAMPGLQTAGPLLDRARSGAFLQLERGQQALAVELAEGAIAGWGQRYDRLSGEIEVRVDGRSVSAAQANNQLRGHPDPERRKAAYVGLQRAWTDSSEACAEALTHIVGYRAVINRRRGVDELAEPLHSSRLDRGTLFAMLEASGRFLPVLWRYMRIKARMLGKDKLDWWDLQAPLDSGRPGPDYADAQRIVVREFGAFSPDMADFAAHALSHRWVEAEDRPGKRQGGFCATLPLSGQTRVFMTYGLGGASLRTLAHELGHAYHFHAMKDLPPSHRQVTSPLAESASNFGEALVRDAMLDEARTTSERVALLDGELRDALTSLVDIPTRYHFERLLYELRARGPFDPAELSDRMVQLQRHHFGRGLGAADPTFWASKLHFYISGRAFYNFPYTFGYLFSNLLWLRGRSEGPAWAPAYRELLRDTGVLSCEELARRHLALDLADPASWNPVFDGITSTVDQLEALTR